MTIRFASSSSDDDDDDDDALGMHWPFWQDDDSLVQEEEDNSIVVVPKKAVTPPESTLSTNTRKRRSGAPNLVTLPLESQLPLTGRSSDVDTNGNSNEIDNDNPNQGVSSTTPSHGPAASVDAATTSSVQAVYHKSAEYVSTTFTTTAIGAVVVKHWNLYSVMALVLALLIHSRGRGRDDGTRVSVLDMTTRSPLRIERATTTALVHDRTDQAVAAATTMTPFTSFPHPILLSTPDVCTVTADTVGDKGDPSVVLIKSGNDDDRDDDMNNRWAVSYHGDLDWKGKLPNGVTEPSHWIQLDFIEPVLLTRVVLDWGACYADHYDLQIRTSTLSPWKTIFMSKDYPITLHSWGQSTSVSGAALHNEDDVPIPAHAFASGLATSLRVFVHDTAHKNGCLSLWHIQVMGYDSVQQERPLVHTELTGPSSLSAGAGAADFAMTASTNFIPPTLTLTNQKATGATRFGWFGSSWRKSSSSSRNGDNSYQHFWHVCSNDSFGGGAWLRLDFPTDMLVTKVVLDWTAGYEVEYTVAVGSDVQGWQTIGHFGMYHGISRDGAHADGNTASTTIGSDGAFTVEALGTFPTSTLSSSSCMDTGRENTMGSSGIGVALHQYTHTLHAPLAQNVPTRHVRIWIHKLATAADDVTPTTAALAVWKVRVFGYKV